MRKNASEEQKPASSVSTELGAHKLFAPPDYSGAISRDAVLRRIFVEHKPKITLLQAPAGHGKSTLLQQAKSACEARGFVTGWLTFDEADNDLRRFSLHLQALLNTMSGANAEDDEDAVRRRRSDWFVARLLRFEQPVGLFFDELQALKNKSILAFLKEVLERLPENVMLFLGSRSLPEIGLARLVVNNQALILGADELRFSQDEIARFFSAAQELWISDDELAAIQRQTEGWPAALQLFRLALSSPSVRNSLVDLGSYRPRELAEYLADNVLALQPPRIRDFLLKTSPLTRLSAPLCDAVTGRQTSQEMLLFLERSGLFLHSLDSEGRWFRYHNLFSSFLAEQLRELSEDTIEAVHHCAAAWHREHGDFEEAVYHAIEVRDYAFAAEALDTWAARLVADGYLMTVERWFEHLPPAELARHAGLLVKIAWALVFLRRQQKLKPVLGMLDAVPPRAFPGALGSQVVRAMAAIMADDIPQAFALIAQVEVRDRAREDFGDFEAFELGAAANLSGYRELALGNFEAAREALGLARAYNRRADATFSGGYTVGLMAMSLLVQGALPEALERFRASQTEQKTWFDKSFASASMVACLIWALYQADQLDEAEALFTQHRDTISESVLLDFLAVAYLAVARIHALRGRYARTLEVLDEAENLAYINKWPRLIGIVGRERLHQALARGEIDKAESIAERLRRDRSAAPEAGWIMFSEDSEGEAMSEIRLHLHRGEGDQALEKIATELATPAIGARVHRQVKLHALEALAHHGKGAAPAARRALRAALRLAEPGGLVRALLEEGPGVVELLRQELAGERAPASGDPASAQSSAKTLRFVERLLAAAGIDYDRPPAAAELQPLEPLTEKEKKILACLSNGVSNKAMARQVFLSENTIKFHLKNIYSKLAVSSRVQAINAARQMGII